MSNYFFDFEFYDDGKGVHPISIGMVDEAGKELYMEYEFDWSTVPPHHWLQGNVRNHLIKEDHELLSKDEVAYEIRKFTDSYKARMWAYYGGYDWVCFCQTFGTAQNLPANVDFLCMDLCQYWKFLGEPNIMPPKPKNAHYALADAQWNLEFWQKLDEYANKTLPDIITSRITI